MSTVDAIIYERNVVAELERLGKTAEEARKLAGDFSNVVLTCWATGWRDATVCARRVVSEAAG